MERELAVSPVCWVLKYNSYWEKCIDHIKGAIVERCIVQMPTRTSFVQPQIWGTTSITYPAIGKPCLFGQRSNFSIVSGLFSKKSLTYTTRSVVGLLKSCFFLDMICGFIACPHPVRRRTQCHGTNSFRFENVGLLYSTIMASLVGAIRRTLASARILLVRSAAVYDSLTFIH